MAETEYLEMRHYVDEARRLYNDLKKLIASTSLKSANKKCEKPNKKANALVSGNRRKRQKKSSWIFAILQKQEWGKVRSRASIDRCEITVNQLASEEQLKKIKS